MERRKTKRQTACCEQMLAPFSRLTGQWRQADDNGEDIETRVKGGGEREDRV